MTTNEIIGGIEQKESFKIEKNSRSVNWEFKILPGTGHLLQASDFERAKKIIDTAREAIISQEGGI